MQKAITFQQELRDRLGLSTGLVRSFGWTLNIMVESIGERDKVLGGDLQKLCREGMAMGHIHLVLKVRNTRIQHPFKLSVLMAVDSELDEMSRNPPKPDDDKPRTCRRKRP
jgi:hypothetical protein